MTRIYLTLLFPLLLIALMWWVVKYVWSVIVDPSHAWDLATSVDQTANAAFNGNMDETISSRAGRVKDDEKWACLLCKFLDRLDKDHCDKNIGV